MKIFIVEDEAELIEIYVDVLETEGHVIVGIAMNGHEAVTRFRELSQRPDVILMDHRMPIKDGIETLKEILGMDSLAKVIMASADISVKKIALQTGAIEFKQKPFSMDKLIANLAGVEKDLAACGSKPAG